MASPKSSGRLCTLHRTNPRGGRIARILGYFRTAEKNLPIGSGVAEAACKTLATQRMNQDYMDVMLLGGTG